MSAQFASAVTTLAEPTFERFRRMHHKVLGGACYSSCTAPRLPGIAGNGGAYFVLGGESVTSVSVFIDMAELRAKLIGDGYWDVATVLQSGNVIVSAEEDRPDEVAGAMRRLLSDEFGIEVACVVRTANQVRGVVVAGSHPVEQRLETVEPLGVGPGAEVGAQSVEGPLRICCGSIVGEREALERVTFGELVSGGVQADGQYPWLRVDVGVEVAEEQDRHGGAHERLE